MKIEVYSDIACPWCYIGKRRLNDALADYDRREEVEVVFRSFQLDPNAPGEPRPLHEELARKFGASVDEMLQNVTTAGENEGIDFDWKSALSVNTLTAHRLLRLALHEYGAETQAKLLDRLFAAHFSLGLDIADHTTLTDLAVEAGLERARVEEYLQSGEGEGETRTELEAARQLGVQSVPTFVLEGRYAIQGAHPAPVLLKAIGELADRIEEDSTNGNA